VKRSTVELTEVQRTAVEHALCYAAITWADPSQFLDALDTMAPHLAASTRMALAADRRERRERERDTENRLGHIWDTAGEKGEWSGWPETA